MGSSSLWSQEDRHNVLACCQGEFPLSWVLGERLEAEATPLWNQRTTSLRKGNHLWVSNLLVALFACILRRISQPALFALLPGICEPSCLLTDLAYFTWSCWVPKTGHLKAEQARTGLLISCPDSMRRLSKEEATTPGWRLDDRIPRVFLVHYMRFPQYVQKKE